MRIFSSNSTHKIDAKGRVSIPASFRRVLELEERPDVVVLNPEMAEKGAIEGMAVSHFHALGATIGRMGQGEKARKLRRHVIGRGREHQIDENGRIVLGADLRAAIELEDEALFVGLGQTFQIWRPDRWLANEAASIEEARELLEEIPWDLSAPGSGE